jgi:hypothetical protein
LIPFANMNMQATTIRIMTIPIMKIVPAASY